MIVARGSSASELDVSTLRRQTSSNLNSRNAGFTSKAKHWQCCLILVHFEAMMQPTRGWSRASRSGWPHGGLIEDDQARDCTKHAIDCSVASMLHIDVMDGRFPPQSVDGPSCVQERPTLRVFTCRDRATNTCRSLMIGDPTDRIESFAHASGADHLTVHIEVLDHPPAMADSDTRSTRVYSRKCNRLPRLIRQAVVDGEACVDMVLVMSVVHWLFGAMASSCNSGA